jgi:hypothetical protein
MQCVKCAYFFEEGGENTAAETSGRPHNVDNFIYSTFLCLYIEIEFYFCFQRDAIFK